MSDYQEEIDRFITELNEVSPVVLHDTSTAVTSLQIGKLFIYLYPPHSLRQAAHPEFQTLHIDVDLLQSSNQKVIHRIQGMLGLGERIFARETVAARIDKKVALEFQEEHHLQVALPGKYRYGLYHAGDLVSVAVFSGGRRMHEEEEDYRSFELLRFCHKGSHHIVGGISKLIDKFASEFHPSDLMTYADLDWCQHSTLEKIGFIPLETKAPQTFYVEKGLRYYSQPADMADGYLVSNSGSLKLKRFF